MQDCISTASDIDETANKQKYPSLHHVPTTSSVSVSASMGAAVSLPVSAAVSATSSCQRRSASSCSSRRQLSAGTEYTGNTSSVPALALLTVGDSGQLRVEQDTESALRSLVDQLGWQVMTVFHRVNASIS